MSENVKCPDCEEMQKINSDYCIWCRQYKGAQDLEKDSNERTCQKILEYKKQIADAFLEAERRGKQ